MKNILLLLYVFIGLHLYAQRPIDHLEIPECSPELIIHHEGFSLLYDEQYEQARWVAYELTRKETVRICERTNKFIEDPLVKTGSACNADYMRSGYDRGHLAPAADMGWSVTTMAESFYYSNMSPQEPGFNRGIWSKLEQLVRTWAVDNEAVYVVTGPILEEGLKRIGPDSVAVPKYYYKVILDNRQPSIKGIGFILPNCGSSEPLGNFAVSIDSVEAVTGIDFFYKLPDSCENKVEKSFSMDEWFFGAVKVAKSTSSVQCRGITKAGNRCKNRTLNESGYCNVHSYQYKL